MKHSRPAAPAGLASAMAALATMLALSAGPAPCARAGPQDAPPARPPAPPAPAAPATADESAEKLIEAYEATEEAWHEKIMKMMAEAEAAGQEFDFTKIPERPEATFIPRFKSLAEKQAGTPHALAALVWIVNHPLWNADGSADTTTTTWAIERIRKHHLAEAGVKDIDFQTVTWALGRKAVTDLCGAILEVSKDNEARASATFHMGWALAADLGPEHREGTDLKRATTLFRQVLADFAGSPFAEPAQGWIYEMDHLQVGMKAPEITGQGPEGGEVRLSQYAGQVVVLDFWGFW